MKKFIPNPSVSMGSGLIKIGIQTLVCGALALAGCASKTIANPQAERSRLFPNGTYQHDVDLTMEIPKTAETTESRSEVVPGSKPAAGPAAGSAKQRTVHFHSVVKITESEINMVALSPLNSTLFRIHEDRKTGQVDTEIYVDALKKIKKQMTDFYSVIRMILTVPLDAEKHSEFHAKDIADGPNKGLVDQLTLKTEAGEAVVKFRDYDKDRIPETILVENPKFNLVIKVSGYAI